MPSLIEGLAAGREPSLLDDILRTAGATAATAGAHAIKGLTLGLIDPTQEVAGYLGEDIYGAAPEWARTGSEIMGSIPTIEGSLWGARKLIPGVGAVPRILQGFTAGAGLGGLEAAISGEDVGGVAEHSLLSGLFFGGVEGLASIPAMMRKRKLKDVQRLWSMTRTLDEVESMAPKTTLEELASTPHAPVTSLQEMMEQTKQLPRGIQLSNEFWKEPNLLMVFQLTEEPMTVQTIDRLVSGKIVEWNNKRVSMQVGPGVVEHFDLKDFRPGRSGVQKLRMFRGTAETHAFPRNTALEMFQARKDIRKLKWNLFKYGNMAKSDMERLERFINPRVKNIKDFSEHELSVFSDYLTKLSKGEQLPDHIMEQLKIYGPAQTDVRVGILSTLKPARWMFESINKKVPWVMDRFFNPTIKAVEKRNLNQLQLMEQVREIAKPFSRKDLRKIYEIDQVLSKKIGVPALTPQYKGIRDSMLERHYQKLQGTIGAKAGELHQAHIKLRELMDKMFEDLVGAGRLGEKRYIKQYWPLLRDQSVITRLFGKPGKGIIPQEALPKEIKGFMQFMRKNLIDHPETDVLKLMQAYISVYTKLMHLAPVVDDMYKIFKDFRVKKDLRELMRHYLARQLGVTSEVDYRIAATIKGVGERIPWVGGKFAKSFTTQDWLRMSAFLNNLPYYAHMGMRPFAAARNLMQPWLTTGPMIGNRWLVRGYQMMLNPKSRDFIKGIGGLQESLGEYTRRLHMRPRFRDKFANWMMWMFRKSDEMNRFAAGLGMASKFDHFFGKLGMTEEFFTKIKLRRFRDSVRIRMRDFSKVYRSMKELEIHGYPKGSPAYEKAQKVIDEFSHKRGFKTSDDVLKEIRETIVKEAIGDTQWLYGKDQSPLFGYRAGFFGRQAMTYQTWWLNYFEFLKNLGRTTKAGDYAPLATALANNMVLTMALMGGAGWSLQKVGRTIAFGPFSGRTIAEGEVPPGVDPLVKALGGVRASLTGDLEGAEKRFNAAIKKTWDNWIPGSLVYKELAKTGWVGPLQLWGQALTPAPTMRHGTTEQKILSVFGAGK